MLAIRQTAITVISCLMLFTSIAAQSVDRTPGHHDHKSLESKPPKDANPTASRSPAKRPGAVTIGSLQIPLTDVEVFDQDGRRKRFYSDLIKDKVVVLSFFFTRCSSICPTMSMALLKLQTNLGDLLKKDVSIITVTKDPQYDTPEKLKDWGKAVGVKPGWTMVTGELRVLEKLALDFTGDGPGPGVHNTIFILGNDRTGEWIVLHEFTSPAELREQVDLLKKPTIGRGSQRRPLRNPDSSLKTFCSSETSIPLHRTAFISLELNSKSSKNSPGV